MERGPGAAERQPGGEAGRDQSGALARSSDRPGKRKALHSGEGDACPSACAALLAAPVARTPLIKLVACLFCM